MTPSGSSPPTQRLPAPWELSLPKNGPGVPFEEVGAGLGSVTGQSPGPAPD
ncbi:hypothetical protein ACIHFD_28095 [Nonomuraea sp. NPDC051941]|uniref:hypothetical protein n=1 Tax=Nonomuraea sp. NPDC051941 TaxID=3364373 RepID=UPI0037C9015A